MTAAPGQEFARLRFLGAAENVTGSRFLLERDRYRLLVDCGLYQEREFASRNWEPFAVPPASIDAVLLSHAHLDHCGYLPRLVRDGFRGPVFCTEATAEVARVMLLDAASIQEEDASFKRRRHEREGRTGPHPEEPLYTVSDARRALRLLKPVPYDETVHVGPGVDAVFRDAGHVLGSATISLTLWRGSERRVVVFSGDLGRPGAPILRDPAPPPAADCVVIESTYGDRTHPPVSIAEGELADAINDAVAAGGNIVIPAFALERAQELLFYLRRLHQAGRIPPLLTFVDSPMATQITSLFKRHAALLDRDVARASRRNRSPFDFTGLHFVGSASESKAINRIRGSVVIIAGAGMCNGGRIKHHLVNNVGDSASTILFVGYQAHGTLGRQIVEGANPVRILGEPREVRARIRSIDAFSAHADRDELLAWLLAAPEPPREVLVVHGEESSAQAFAATIRSRIGAAVSIPAFGDSFAIV